MTIDRILKADGRARRPTRVPVSGTRDLITIKNKEPGFHYHIVKEKPGRIDKFLAAGYEIVTHEVSVGDVKIGTPGQEGSPVKMPLGRGEVGYLMRQPNEFYEEDQAAKQAEVKAREETMISKRSDGTYGSIEVSRPQSKIGD